MDIIFVVDPWLSDALGEFSSKLYVPSTPPHWHPACVGGGGGGNNVHGITKLVYTQSITWPPACVCAHACVSGGSYVLDGVTLLNPSHDLLHVCVRACACMRVWRKLPIRRLTLLHLYRRRNSTTLHGSHFILRSLHASERWANLAFYCSMTNKEGKMASVENPRGVCYWL